MPNWVKTIVKTKPDVLEDIANKYFENNKFSFNKVIPMPKDLDIEVSGSGEEGLMFLFADSKDDLLKIKINNAFKDLNMFHSDIYRDSRFEDIEENTDIVIGTIGVLITGELNGILVIFKKVKIQ